MHSGIPHPGEVEDRAGLADALDAASHDRRVAWLHTLGRRRLQALFRLARGSRLEVGKFVRADGEVLVGRGKNMIPLVFNRFQKRFARVGEEVAGYNHTSSLARWWVGVGHFVVRSSPEVEGEVWFDYTRLPPSAHPEFPPLEAQRAPLYPLVYHDMVDVVRRVSREVVVGRSFKPSGRIGLNGGATFAIVLEPHQ